MTYELTNNQSAWEGFITLTEKVPGITTQVQVALPQNSRQVIHIPYHLTVKADLRIHIGAEVSPEQELRLPITPVTNNRVCAYVGHSVAVTPPTFSKCAHFIHLESITELPETPMAWDTVDVLILNDINSNRLSPAQIEGMLAWVAQGGHLVAGGSQSLDLTLQALPSVLRIAKPGSTQIVERVESLSSAGENMSITPLWLTDGAYSLLEQENSVYAARKKVGQGTVDILGWDPMLMRASDWLQELWQDDHVPATATHMLDQTGISANLGPSRFELE
ncbi:MAG: hypothetical protein P1S60_06495, partial [Anaerolineae bacterium]|nr:hypothetical protein [Anaerolineae bacterium]